MLMRQKRALIDASLVNLGHLECRVFPQHSIDTATHYHFFIYRRWNCQALSVVQSPLIGCGRRFWLMAMEPLMAINAILSHLRIAQPARWAEGGC
jgi:hypothetical protein